MSIQRQIAFNLNEVCVSFGMEDMPGGILDNVFMSVTVYDDGTYKVVHKELSSSDMSFEQKKNEVLAND